MQVETTMHMFAHVERNYAWIVANGAMHLLVSPAEQRCVIIIFYSNDYLDTTWITFKKQTLLCCNEAHFLFVPSRLVSRDIHSETCVSRAPTAK